MSGVILFPPKVFKRIAGWQKRNTSLTHSLTHHVGSRKYCRVVWEAGGILGGKQVDPSSLVGADSWSQLDVSGVRDSHYRHSVLISKQIPKSTCVRASRKKILYQNMSTPETKASLSPSTSDRYQLGSLLA